MTVNNVNTGAINWDTLLGKLGEVTKTEGADGVAGTTNVTITTTVDGVETPLTISIPDDLELPEVVDQAAIDTLCEKLAADTGLNFSEEQIRQIHDAFSAVLAEMTEAVAKDGETFNFKGTMFDLYKLMVLLVEVAQKQRDATRAMRQSENQLIQQSILNQAEAQRDAAITGMIASAICCFAQIAATTIALVSQGRAFNEQLGTDKTSGVDSARMKMELTKGANNLQNAEKQLTNVKSSVGNKMSLDGRTTIQSKVEGSFNNQSFNKSSADFVKANTTFQTKVETSRTLQNAGNEPYLSELTSDALRPLESPEVKPVKAAMEKVEAFNSLTEQERAFVTEKANTPFHKLSMADKVKMTEIQQKCGSVDPRSLSGKTAAELKAELKSAIDTAAADLRQQTAANGPLQAEIDMTKANYRAQTKLEMQKFEDAYDNALRDYNDVRKTGTKAEISNAKAKLQTAADELKYARAYGNMKLMSHGATDATTHLADVEEARTQHIQAQNTRANSVDYIKASNTINQAQAVNGLIAAVGGFLQGLIQNGTQMMMADATMAGAEQKKSEEELDQTKDLFNQAEELVRNIVQLMQAVRQAETQSMRDAIQA